VIGASTGLFGAVWAQAETRKAMSIAGADVLEDEFPLGQADIAFDDDGSLLDSELSERLSEIVARLAEHQREPAAAA
jgi:chromate reductase